MHTRGTLEGFKRIASEQKWLEVHGRKKWAYYYEPESVRRQQAFFDHFLKGVDSPLKDWPRVRLEVRERYYQGRMQSEQEWPLARTRYTSLYLDAQSHSLQLEPLIAESRCRYRSDDAAENPDQAVFNYRFDKTTDLIGHMKLRLWAAAEDAEDMDIFIATQKIDRQGKVVPFAFWAHFENGPIALGWIRASHRELDPELSTDWQPVLKHQRELKLIPGEPVCLEIEIWPSGTRFEAGESLRLVIQGSDVYKYPKPTMADRHEESVNRGYHTILTGGTYASHLLVPVIP
jgi:putative CocE/NonD family hydrolase